MLIFITTRRPHRTVDYIKSLHSKIACLEAGGGDPRGSPSWEEDMESGSESDAGSTQQQTARPPHAPSALPSHCNPSAVSSPMAQVSFTYSSSSLSISSSPFPSSTPRSPPAPSSWSTTGLVPLPPPGLRHLLHSPSSTSHQTLPGIATFDSLPARQMNQTTQQDEMFAASLLLSFSSPEVRATMGGVPMEVLDAGGWKLDG